MTHLLMARLAANDGVITTRELNELDYDRHAISALVVNGTLRRVRPRAYVHEPAASAAEPDVRHAMEVRSVLRTMPRYAATHVSALAVWGLPVVFTELTRINIARIGDGSPRNSRRVRVHPPVEAAAVTRHRGVDVVQAGVAIVQVAPESVAGALMAADSAVRTSQLSQEGLTRLARSSGSPQARRVARLVSRLSESAGESWCRLLFDGFGIPQPEQQVEIYDEAGSFVARVDFLLRSHRVIVEFDGAVKYGGAGGRDALVREKQREDRLRALGYRVVRLTWTDLRDPARVLALLGLGLAA